MFYVNKHLYLIDAVETSPCGIYNQSEGRNGLWQSLGAWVVLGLVLGAGLFKHGAAQSY